MTIVRFNGGYGRLDVHEAVVQSYVEPGGAVWELVRDVTSDTRRHAKRLAPRRSGRLAGGIASKNPGSGPLMAEARVTSSAKHGRYVMGGTGVIRPRNGKFLLIPGRSVSGMGLDAASARVYSGLGAKMKVENPKAGGLMWMKRIAVKGQAPNPFFEAALTIALRENGL